MEFSGSKRFCQSHQFFHASVRLEIFKTIVSRQNGKCTQIIFFVDNNLICHCLLLFVTETSTKFLLTSSKQCRQQ